MNRTKAIIIDDEARARFTLRELLKEFCPSIEILEECSNVPDGVLAINKLQPDVVFLDVEMPVYNGFELFNFIQNPQFEVIFVTAYNQYALRAFEVSAVDYLIKPIEIESLQRAVARVIPKENIQTVHERVETLTENLSAESIKKIAVPMSDGLLFIHLDDIIFLEADGSYTTVHTQTKGRVVVSKKLKYFETLLQDKPLFYRSHRSNIVHLNHLTKYLRGEGTILLDNGLSISIARDKKQEFESILKEQGFI